MSKINFTAEDDALLNELGVASKVNIIANYTSLEERIIAGFEEILQFFKENKRAPLNSSDKDIFERMYAIRLKRIISVQSNRELLRKFDTLGIIDKNSSTKTIETDDLDDTELLEELGIDLDVDSSISKLKFVKPRVAINVADEVAFRTKCREFDKFVGLFSQVKENLKRNQLSIIKYKDDASIERGDFFILSGHITYIAEKGVEFTNKYGRTDSKLRVIFDNGTETNGLLMRSLQRALNKDSTARRLKFNQPASLFSDKFEDGDINSGKIYVLKSKSNHPTVVENRDIIHKIGVTGGNVKTRISNAKNDPTFLMADVEVVAEYHLANINRIKLESLIHKFFENARLDIEIRDRFGKRVTIKEWYIVPLFIIDEMINKLQDGTIDKYTYDIKSAKLKKI